MSLSLRPQFKAKRPEGRSKHFAGLNTAWNNKYFQALDAQGSGTSVRGCMGVWMRGCVGACIPLVVYLSVCLSLGIYVLSVSWYICIVCVYTHENIVKTLISQDYATRLCPC